MALSRNPSSPTLRRGYSPRPLKPGPLWAILNDMGVLVPGQEWRGQDASYWIRLDGKVKVWAWPTIRTNWGVDRRTTI